MWTVWMMQTMMTNRVRAVGCPVGGAQRLLLHSSVLRNTPDQIIVIGSKHVR